jgi:hypothetical protein
MYFESEHRDPNGGGLRKLALVSQKKGAQSFSDVFSDPEFEHMLLLTKLASTLSPLQQADLAKYTKLTAAIASSNTKSLPTDVNADQKGAQQSCRKNCPMQYKLPETLSNICRTTTEGPNSVMANLPHLPVISLHEYGVVSLRDCKADLLGHGLTIDAISWSDFVEEDGEMRRPPSVSKLIQSERALAIYKRAMVSTNND